MLEQALRSYYQQYLLDPIAKQIDHHVSPLTITFLSGVVGITSAIAFIYQNIYLAIFLLWLSGALDTLDGTLARLQNACTAIGAVYDILIDRVVEIAIIFSLYWLAPTIRSFPTLLMLASILLCVTSFLVVAIFTTNNSSKSFYYSPGIIERAEAFIFFTLMMLFANAFIFLAMLFSLLVCITTLVRVIEFTRMTSEFNT